jgi:hypothetical protein
MREYEVKRSVLAFAFGRLVLLTLLAVLGVLFVEPRVFFVAVLLAVAWIWFQALRSPAKVRCRDDGAIELCGPIRRVVARPDEIDQIVQVGRRYWLHLPSGWLSLHGYGPNLQQFISYLTAANPALEVKVFRWGQEKG